MRPLSVWFVPLAVACSSPTAAPSTAPDPAPSGDVSNSCYALHLGGTVSPDVTLPAVIELSREPAPNFVHPGRFAVREPGAAAPRAPISWWIPLSHNAIELVLGGGYTGYTFQLKSAGGGEWAGQGSYFADFGLEPAPGPLPLRLTPSSCG
jgi:hypothetical protein